MSSDDLLKRNKKLTEQIARSDVGNRLSKVDRNQKILAVSVALDILLSVGLGVLGKVAYDAAQKATVSSSQTRINCLASNQTRLQSQQLWAFVLSFPPPVNETPAARQQRLASTAKFKTYIKTIFAPRNCNATTARGGGVVPSPIPLPLVTRPANRTQSMGPAKRPQVTVTVIVSQRPSSSSTPAPTPSSHSPPPTESPAPTPQPKPTKTCIIGPPLCLPPIGARPWQHPDALPVGLTTAQIESLVSALHPRLEVVWATQLRPSPTPLSLARLLVPWMYPIRVVISIQSSSWAIQAAIPLTLGT
jgi:hypothetical protein